MTDSKRAAAALPSLPEPFAYPKGDVIAACACGSWPGGPCLRCPVVSFYTAEQVESIRRETVMACAAAVAAVGALYSDQDDLGVANDCELAVLALLENSHAKAVQSDSVSALRADVAPGPDLAPEWLPIASAPRDGTQFLALNHDGEVWLAKYTDRGAAPPSIVYRTNKLTETSRHQVHNIDGKRLLELLESSEEWCSHWTFWSRGYEFTPTHWLALPIAPRRGALAGAPGSNEHESASVSSSTGAAPKGDA